MRPLFVLPCLLLLLALPLALSAPAQAADADLLAINVVEARDLGCSDDGGLSGDADLRVVVRVDGHERLTTAKAQGQEAPAFAAYAEVRQVALPATVTVEVQEAEPGGFFGAGTEWVTCDASPGGAKVFETAWDGTQVEFTARGDASDAAEARVVLGPSPPPRPVVEVTNVTSQAATLSWDGHDDASEHRVRTATVGPFVAEGDGGAGSARLDGLCDNTAYEAWVVRVVEPWHVPSKRAAFTTENVAPEAPVVVRAEPGANGTVDLAWATATVHDVARFELHAGPAGFEASNGTRVATVTGPVVGGTHLSHELQRLDDGATHVRVRTVDTGGLAALSEAFPVGGEPREDVTVTPTCPGHLAATPAQPDAGGQAEPDGAHSEPAPAPDRLDPDPTLDPPRFPGDGATASSDGERSAIVLDGWWLGLAAGVLVTLVAVALVALVRR